LKQLEERRKIRKMEICNAIGGELADENTCIVNGFGSLGRLKNKYLNS
jgi:hypothetical protein